MTSLIASERYTYDATSQLAGVDYGTPARGAETFAYDAVRNRTEVGRVVPNAPPSTPSTSTPLSPALHSLTTPTERNERVM
jgi:hypothetical protein